jgi:hypothetical protein
VADYLPRGANRTWIRFTDTDTDMNGELGEHLRQQPPREAKVMPPAGEKKECRDSLQTPHFGSHHAIISRSLLFSFRLGSVVLAGLDPYFLAKTCVDNSARVTGQ